MNMLQSVSACLYYHGHDSNGVLERLFTAVVGSPRQQRADYAAINILNFSATTVLGRASILAELRGEEDDVRQAALRVQAIAEERGEIGRIEIIRNTEKWSYDFLPFPWQLQVSAPDEPGVLTSLCNFLYESGVKITACSGEVYQPRQSPLAGRTACELRLTILLPRSIDRSDFEVNMDLRSRQCGYLEWTLKKLE
ncbi:MAG: hypothetical protein JNK49_05360 [Planctomycetes bacterium]|nr:hypothetical protein [Planctomycetota bacterium]